MKSLMIISTAHGGAFFSLAYLAAFSVAAGFMIFEGFRRRYPKNAWLLILVTGVIFFIIGNKIFTYSLQQWTDVFTRFRFAETDGKTVLGGIAGLIAGLLLAKSWLRFNCPLWDALAVPLPLAMAVSRIGCLLAGCCFGTPSNVPWGIQYDSASYAYQAHLANGLIHIHDTASLAVHPTQLYQAAGCLIIAVIVMITRKRWRSAGSQFLFSVICYLDLRFFAEFFLAGAPSSFYSHVFAGLKIIQWIIILVLIPGIITLIIREKQRLVSMPVPGKNWLPVARQNILTVSLCIFVLFARNWFTFLELSTILLFLVPVLIMLFIKFYQSHSVRGLRWIVPVLLVSSVSFMAQKSVQNGRENDKVIFTELGFTGIVGRYNDAIGMVTDESCGGQVRQGYNNDARTFYQGGIDFSYNNWHGKYRKLNLGARVFAGGESGDIAIDYPYPLTYGISPYFNFDWRWIGIGTGITIGQLKLYENFPAIEFGDEMFNDNPQHHHGDMISRNYANRNITGSLTVRLGPYDICYLEGSFPGMFPSSSPVLGCQVGIGSGLGKTNGTKAALGWCYDSYTPFNNYLYTEIKYPLKSGIVLKAFFANNFSSGSNAKRVLSLGISYRIFSKNTSVQTAR